MQKDGEAYALCAGWREDEVRESVPLFDMLMRADAAPLIARHGLAFCIAEDDSRAWGDGWLAACIGIGIICGDDWGGSWIIPVRECDAIAGAWLDLDCVAE